MPESEKFVDSKFAKYVAGEYIPDDPVKEAELTAECAQIDYDMMFIDIICSQTPPEWGDTFESRVNAWEQERGYPLTPEERQKFNDLISDSPLDNL